MRPLTHIALALAIVAPILAAKKPDPAFRTTVPEVTPSRWRKAPPPIPKPRTITRDDYRKFIVRTYKTLKAAALKRAGDPTQKNQDNDALREAFFWLATKDPKRAKLAVKMIQGDTAYRTTGPGAERKTSFAVIGPAVETYRRLRDCPALTPADHAVCKKWLLLIEKKLAHKEKGAHNRSFGCALGLDAIRHWWPKEPGNAQRKLYADTVWNDWWKHRDSIENSTSYNSLWWQFTRTWVDITGRPCFQDPGAKALAERWLAHVCPLGVPPNYGDGPGWNRTPGKWIAHFERWATEYRDGRFKWAAHRLFEYVERHEKEMWQWGQLNHWTMDALMNAWLDADDSIAEEVPDIPSVLTRRHAIRHVTDRKERRETGYHALVTDEVIPSKVILRTGWGPADTYLMVEAARILSHDHEHAGSINCLVSAGSVLLADTSYMVRGHQHHNSFVVLPDGLKAKRWHPRIAEDLVKMRVAVDDLHHGPAGSVARVTITDFMGHPATVVREVFLMGDAAVWVRDTVTPVKSIRAQFGPAWQTTAVYGKQGDNWANTALVTLPVAYNMEHKYMMQWGNRPWDLLVWFAPDDGARMAIDDVTRDDSPDTLLTYKVPRQNNMTRRLWYRKHQPLQAKQPQRFTSVLLPHRPTDDASRLAEGIQSILDSEQAAVVKVTPSPHTEVWAGMNHTGEPVEAGRIKTDAKFFLVTIKGGNVTAQWLVEGTTLEVDGKPVPVTQGS